MIDGIQTEDSGFNDDLRVWNEHMAMIDEVSETFIQGREAGDFTFRQVNAHETIIEVRVEERQPYHM